MINQRQFVQMSCSITESLGGPSRVVKGANRYIKYFMKTDLVIFGEVDCDIQANVFPSLFNNRYGVPRKFIWNRAVGILKTADVIFIHGFYTFVTLFSLVHGKRSSKYFIMPHGSLEDYESVKRKFLKSLFRSVIVILVRDRDLTFVVASEQEKLSISKRFPNSPIEFLGLGIEYLGEPTIRQNDFTTLNLVCISRIAIKKRIDLFLGAVKLMRNEGINVELHILGSGDIQLTNSLKELARILDLVQVVHFHGHMTRDAIKQILPQMHIFLLPSENENFAVAVAEAISDGLPTVVSDNVAMHTFVEANVTGIVISELSTESLKNAILTVKNNIENYSINAINSRFRLSWEEVIKNWEKVLCK